MMELQEWKPAIKLLQDHAWTSTQTGSFGDVKDWYLALALLYAGNTADSQELLTKIFNRKGYEYINAGKLLEDIHASEN